MPKFMNAELVAIRDSLACGHCRSTFKGSDSQAWKVKYESRTVYCSRACRKAAIANKLCTPIPNRGPCKGCGEEFFSRAAKLFCSLDCYLNSSQMKEHMRAMGEKSKSTEVLGKIATSLRKGGILSCLECDAEVYSKRSRRRKFCTLVCYRAYMSKRFDRWIANPEGMALLQCYDEFLDQEELPCIIDGCGWVGVHLTVHVNQAHGFPAAEFKRAAGFNIGTGVIAKPLAKLFQQRPAQGIAVAPSDGALEAARQELKSNPIRYHSLESREHMRKARAQASGGPERKCKGCGSLFQQRTPFGRALYCSKTCRKLTA